MKVDQITPVLNVSDVVSTFAWFESWGWTKRWELGTPPFFGSVSAGSDLQISLCRNAQGGRGKGPNTTTFTVDGDESADKGVWISVFVDDVDAVYQDCVAKGIEVTFPPTNMPWEVREMHVRHPDGHVFRVGPESSTADHFVPESSSKSALTEVSSWSESPTHLWTCHPKRSAYTHRIVILNTTDPPKKCHPEHSAPA